MKTQYMAVLIALVFLTASLPAQARDVSFPPLPEALEALEPDDVLDVYRGEFIGEEESPFYYVFMPRDVQPATGFIFYPGGKVDARSYAPPAREIAEAGYLVVIVYMPQDLAHLGWRRALQVQREFGGISTWVIGGHSMGGSFACAYARRYSLRVDGVVLWDSWPSFLFRLDRRCMQAVSIYGTEGGNPDSIERGARHLPKGAQFVKIEGGNHTQFGFYDTAPDEQQPGDNPALISRQEQQAQIVAATIDFLDTVHQHRGGK